MAWNNIYSLTCMEARNAKPGCQGFLWKLKNRIYSGVLLDSEVATVLPRHFLAYRNNAPVSASTVTWCSPCLFMLSFLVLISVSSSHIRIPVMLNQEPTSVQSDLILIWLITSAMVFLPLEVPEDTYFERTLINAVQLVSNETDTAWLNWGFWPLWSWPWCSGLSLTHN